MLLIVFTHCTSLWIGRLSTENPKRISIHTSHRAMCLQGLGLCSNLSAVSSDRVLALGITTLSPLTAILLGQRNQEINDA